MRRRHDYTQVHSVASPDLPGSRSRHGRRHNNDHTDIGEIELLPTFDEIRSTRPEYIPTRDPLQRHLTGVQGLLDQQFRLLREDMVGPLRESIRAEMNHDDRWRMKVRSQTATFTYTNLQVVDSTFSTWRGLELTVRIDQPPHLYDKNPHFRRHWWRVSRRLDIDTLVCILSRNGCVIFCTVAEHEADDKSQRTPRLCAVAKDQTCQRTGRKLKTSGHSRFCYLKLQLAQRDLKMIRRAFSDLSMICASENVLVEFRDILLPAYQPVLKALQEINRTEKLPFHEWLAKHGAIGPLPRIPPPQYAVAPDFRFDMSSIIRGDQKVTYALGEELDTSQSRLDDGQVGALLDCLHRSLALVQGPPGTGKSFTSIGLIKVLLAVQESAELGPIMCVSYTNHALDQLLESLVKQGVRRIVRVGSRSKSEILRNYNVRAVARDSPLTSMQKRQLWETKRLLQDETREINTMLDAVLKWKDWQTVKSYLASHHPDHHAQLFTSPNSQDACEITHHGRGDEIQCWLQAHLRPAPNDHPRAIPELLASDLFTMASSERLALYRHWTTELWRVLSERAVRAIQSHERTKELYDDIKAGQELRCLSHSCVIGVTTTASARYRELFQRLGPKVLICEEAGEIVEAHMLTALAPSLQHLILVGDHLQLPPHILNHQLSRENPQGMRYSLDLSLFERLIRPVDARQVGLRPSFLQMQRRMHPSISDLVRSTLYPYLQNSAHVKAYPEVAGMKKRLFWLDHRHPEASPSSKHRVSATSYSNAFEIEMVVALVRHLLRQAEYNTADIAVLTPYLDQCLKIRESMQQSSEVVKTENDVQTMKRASQSQIWVTLAETPTSDLLKTVRVSTIDNFQGEEAKIVIISLVRSNDGRRCGFLKMSNRINVLLSRAKHGMYIIGNTSTFQGVEMWANVISTLQTLNNLGTRLELQCPRHPESSLHTSSPGDFKTFAPEGGCNKDCDQRLFCGHICTSKCHSQVLHRVAQCRRQVSLTNTAGDLDHGPKTVTLPCWQARRQTSTVSHINI